MLRVLCIALFTLPAMHQCIANEPASPFDRASVDFERRVEAIGAIMRREGVPPLPAQTAQPQATRFIEHPPLPVGHKLRKPL